jgi:EAL domain-containing protein (putative c-di-GMP-specific phosphodiesterase class I)
VSGRQMADPNLVDDVAHILSVTGLDPQCLILEITESVLVLNVEETVATFRALKALGLRLAIDDFGTGYSSLSYLRQFPVDILKVDRSFVASLDGGTDSIALVRSIVSLSSTLRLDTVAEGIETAEQRQVLRGLGAQHGQGHLFAHAMEPGQLGDLLAHGAATGSNAPSGPPGPSSSDPRRPNGRSGRRATGIPASQP